MRLTRLPKLPDGDLRVKIYVGHEGFVRSEYFKKGTWAKWDECWVDPETTKVVYELIDDTTQSFTRLM